RTEIGLLGDVVKQHCHAHKDFYAGGNTIIYYSSEQARSRDYRGPDCLVVLDVDGSQENICVVRNYMADRPYAPVMMVNDLAMVYQDPMQALNPSMRLGDQMKEVLTVHRNLSEDEAEKRCLQMLERVYMPDPANVMRRYPHQISGGQQQRVVIAMALLNNPALLIMDEPTTALDVTVEAAVLDLVADLRRDFDTAILFISHNLGVIARVSDRVGVMYAGELV